LKQKFRPAIGLKNGHLQTLFPALFRKFDKPKVEIEIFELPDGDFVECFWHHKPTSSDNRIIVTLFHGLAGSFDSPYIGGMMKALSAIHVSSVLMHFGGSSGRENRKARSYHSGETEDAKAWIRALHHRYPHHKLFGVGYSLGGKYSRKINFKKRTKNA
jgi:uncharacterized protein